MCVTLFSLIMYICIVIYNHLFESQDVLEKRSGPDTVTPSNLFVDSWPCRAIGWCYIWLQTLASSSPKVLRYCPDRYIYI